MGRAAADNRSRGKSYSNANAATPRAGSAIGKHKSFSRKGWQCKRLSFGRSHRPFSFSGKKMGGCSCGAHAAHPSARRAENPSSIFLTKNPQHGMLSAIKAARKKPFLFTRSREGTAGASPCGTEKAALLSRAAEMPRRSLRYKGTKCPASSGEFRWNHGQ